MPDADQDHIVYSNEGAGGIADVFVSYQGSVESFWVSFGGLFYGPYTMNAAFAVADDLADTDFDEDQAPMGLGL